MADSHFSHRLDEIQALLADLSSRLGDLPDAARATAAARLQALLRESRRGPRRRHMRLPRWRRAARMARRIAPRAAAALSPAQKLDLLERALLGVVYEWDLAGGQVAYSQRVEDLLGLPAAQLPHDRQGWLERIHPQDLARVQAIIHQVLSGDTGGFVLEYRLQAAETGWIDIWDRAAVQRDAQGQAVRVVGVVTNISQRRQAERRLEQHELEAHTQMLVQHQLLEHREMERQQIARNIHDGPIQRLGGLAFALQLMHHLSENPEVMDGLRALQVEVKSLSQDLREVCSDLRAPALERFGLARSMQMHIDDFHNKHADIEVVLTASGSDEGLPEVLGLTLFRIFQECLNNVARHSQANHVEAGLCIDQQTATLEVQDNGSGFSTGQSASEGQPAAMGQPAAEGQPSAPIDWMELAHQGHFGLIGMKERAEAVGGSLQIHSCPGTGTTIRVRVPREGVNALNLGGISAVDPC